MCVRKSVILTLVILWCVGNPAQVFIAYFCAVDFLEFTETTLRAIIHGAKTEDFEEDVKAVTYHEVEVKKNEAGNYETLIIFDI